MIAEQFTQWFGTDPVVHGLVGGVVIASLNLLGASLVFVWRNPSERAMDGALGFAAGVMLAASLTVSIIPGIETYSNGNPIPVLVGVAVGALLLDRSDVLVPHAHYLLSGRRGGVARRPVRALPEVHLRPPRGRGSWPRVGPPRAGHQFSTPEEKPWTVPVVSPHSRSACSPWVPHPRSAKDRSGSSDKAVTYTESPRRSEAPVLR